MSSGMSLESALAEEAREVVAILEGRNLKQTTRPRAASPAGVAQSPVRSMLDIGDFTGPKARHASVAGVGVGVTKPGAPFTAREPIRSMLDTTSPPPTPGVADPYRPTSKSPPPPIPKPLTSPTFNPEDAYQFDILPSSDRGALPKRVSQGGKKRKGAMASVFGSSSNRSRDTRHGPFLTRSSKSRSPGPDRSQSPSTTLLNTNSMNLMTGPGKFVISDSGQLIDMDNAYRRLSDAALLKSGGSLSQLPTRKDYNKVTGEQLAPGGGVRLAKDYQPPDEDAIQSSDEADEDTDEDDAGESRRGRGRTRKGSNEQDGDDDEEGAEKRKPKSLLAAAEQERKDIAVNYKYTSLLGPPVEVTAPSGEKVSAKTRTGIHPTTSFDMSASDASTPYDSDNEEDMNDIRHAQKMKIAISPIHSTPAAHRCIRQITRGDFVRFQEEAEKGLRRQRMYLVATDLSDEAAYALEWTIGTVLRDGDTLLAVYAVDEEVGTGGEATPSALETGQGASVVRDMASAVKTLSNEVSLTVPGSSSHSPSPFRASSLSINQDTGSRVRGADGELDVSKMDKAERERYFAVKEVSARCVSLLRKTRLQVRVVVEVFHCKSPKHMITEVVSPPSLPFLNASLMFVQIDFLEPTLVILGSRGRSALKGVLLGSFSNYLVTKSSVPVMVARKKLRKHSKSVSLRDHMRFSNVLQDPTTGKMNRLLGARID